MITINILLVATLIGLAVRYWPWSKEVVEDTKGQDLFEKTWDGRVVHSRRRTWVIYRITNRYTKSVTLKKKYLD